MMNRQQRRLSEANGRKLQKQEWDEFKDVTKEAIAKHLYFNNDSTFRPHRVAQNSKYVVLVFYHQKLNGHFYTKVMCRRSDAEPIYSWQDLYRIKNELFGEEVEAIQIMPKVSELVDQANLYWFWIKELNTSQVVLECPECRKFNAIRVGDISDENAIFRCQDCDHLWMPEGLDG